MLVTVDTEDLDSVCRECGRVDDTVYSRYYTTKDYQGSCGDSFCYAGCTMSACKPVQRSICDRCYKRLKK